jgi:hypothetical protein
MTEQGQSTRVSRRTIAKGAAWAVPVVPLAVATPAYAQSGCVPTLSFSPDSCRCTGVGQNAKDYYVSICNTGTTCPDSDGILYVSIRANTGNDHEEFVPGLTIAVPVGGCSEPVHFNSGNSSLKIRFYYGSTPEEALAADNPNYVVVDAPNDCNDLPEDERLGDCVQG